MATKELRDMTLRELEREYLDAVRAIALEAAEIAGEDERDTFIYESVDGNEWVIYTYRARLVAVLTEHVDEWEENGSGDPAGATPEVVAFYAMRRDVEEEIARIERDNG